MEDLLPIKMIYKTGSLYSKLDPCPTDLQVQIQIKCYDDITLISLSNVQIRYIYSSCGY